MQRACATPDGAATTARRTRAAARRVSRTATAFSCEARQSASARTASRAARARLTLAARGAALAAATALTVPAAATAGRRRGVRRRRAVRGALPRPRRVPGGGGERARPLRVRCGLGRRGVRARPAMPAGVRARRVPRRRVRARRGTAAARARRRCAGGCGHGGRCVAPGRCECEDGWAEAPAAALQPRGLPSTRRRRKPPPAWSKLVEGGRRSATSRSARRWGATRGRARASRRTSACASPASEASTAQPASQSAPTFGGSSPRAAAVPRRSTRSRRRSCRRIRRRRCVATSASRWAKAGPSAGHGTRRISGAPTRAPPAGSRGNRCPSGGGCARRDGRRSTSPSRRSGRACSATVARGRHRRRRWRGRGGGGRKGQRRVSQHVGEAREHRVDGTRGGGAHGGRRQAARPPWPLRARRPHLVRASDHEVEVEWEVPPTAAEYEVTVQQLGQPRWLWPRVSRLEVELEWLS